MSYITDYISGLSKPNCAVSVNGNYLEDLVVGYRTLSVEGRNTNSTDITELTIGNSNGSHYRYKRDESKDITVSFALAADSIQAVHKQSELLQKTLNTAESQFIFYDEQNVYWTGTVSNYSEDEYPDNGGSDIAVMKGTFTIRCHSPYRYATTLKTVTTNGLQGTNTVSLTNDGTVPVPLTIQSYMWDGSPYLAYSLGKDDNESLNYIMGTATEVDSTSSSDEQAKTLLDTKDFSSDTGGWTVNAGVLPPLDVSTSQEGTFREYDEDSSGLDVLDYGDSTSGWHGPSASHIIPSSNNKYPMNWRVNWSWHFATGESPRETSMSTKYYGIQAATFSDGAGTPLVSFVMMDNTSDSKSYLYMYVGTKKYSVGQIPDNNVHIIPAGSVTIEKIDDDIHLTCLSMKPGKTNTSNYANWTDQSKDIINLEGTADLAANPAVLVRLKLTAKESSYNTSDNSSVIQFTCDAYQETSWPQETLRQQITTGNNVAGKIDIYINGQCVCTEWVPMKGTDTDPNLTTSYKVWSSGTRGFRVPHNDDGKKECEIYMVMSEGTHNDKNFYWTSMSKVSDTLHLTDIKTETYSTSIDNFISFDTHYTATNPTATIKQVTFWGAAYGDEYDSDNKTGYGRFNYNNIESVKVIKYADTKTAAQDNAAYFSSGDTINLYSDSNTVTQNGTINQNFVDVASQPLMLYPGSHKLKVLVDNADNGNRPPTMIITYRERWK